jgi:hypothetical protein
MLKSLPFNRLGSCVINSGGVRLVKLLILLGAGFALANVLAAESPADLTKQPSSAASDSTNRPATIRVLPTDFTLYGAQGRQRIVVTGLVGETPSAAVAEDRIMLESTDESVFRVADGHAIAVGDGSAELIAKLDDGATATARVRVEGVSTTESSTISFRNDVQSVLSRLGCNMGSCHGALAGKGGFRLSLRGYDSEADYGTIARQLRGRRIEIADPGKSLMLAKPTGALPHKGGLRLLADSRDYHVIADWIASGAPAPQADDPRLTSISVLPANAILTPGDTSQILVNAHYDDGRTIDVTHWAKFTATDEAVAGVDDFGKVSVRGSGEAAVLVWFGSQVTLSRMTVPFGHEIDDEVYEHAPRRNFIDDLNLEQLQTLRLLPSPRADKETFIRRATIDTIGRLPTIDETHQFLSDHRPDSRNRLIDRLLASEDYVHYWAYKWSDLLLVNGTKLRPVAVESFYKWIKQSVRENRPWDQLVHDVLIATGDSRDNGATNFYAIHQSPEEMTENASQAFLGLSIGCAKCHNHPLEKWTNDQYYAMANLFARVRAKGWGGEPRNGDGIRTLYVAQSGDLIQPGRGKPQPPAPLDADPIDFDDPTDRREAAANWITSPDNPYFARAITNRVWANFFGRGLVEAVDDLRLSNPASNEPLLAATSQHLIDSQFDLKQLMRTILESETYARSSEPLPENADEMKYHSRYYPRRLMAEVLLDAIDQVLQTSSSFTTVAFPGADSQKTDLYPPGTRAIELYDSAIESYFLKTFGRNPREITCECERSSEPSMVQVLHLSNGETINPKLADPSNTISQLIKQGRTNHQIIEELFVAALSRQPSDSEIKRLLAVMAEYGDDRRMAIEDAFWSILASTEFTFNH